MERIEELRGKDSLSIEEKIELKRLENAEQKEQKNGRAKGVFLEELLEEVIYIPIEKIEYPEYKDRSGIEDGKLKELADSILKDGLLQPIVVTKKENGNFLKLAGLRRILAHKILGKTKIKANVISKEKNSYEHLLCVLHENTVRDELTIYDKVRGVVKLISIELNKDEEEVRKIIVRANNFSRGNIIGGRGTEEDTQNIERINRVLRDSMIFNTISTLCNSLSILDMPDSILSALKKDSISFSLAQKLNTLCKASSEEEMQEWLIKIMSGEVGIYELENFIKLKKEKSKKLTFVGHFKLRYEAVPKEKRKAFEEELERLLEKYKQ